MVLTREVTKVSKTSLLQRFCAATDAPSSDAQKYLRDHGYRLDAAVDAYFMAQGDSSAVLSPQQEKEARVVLTRLFQQYKDPTEAEDAITAAGAMAMLQDLAVDPGSVVIIPLSYYLGSPSLGHFPRGEYIDGWLRLGVGASASGALTKEDLIYQQKEAVAAILDAFQSDAPLMPPLAAPGKPVRPPTKKGLYTTAYDYAFSFACPEGQKNLPLEVALTFWDLLLPSAPTFDADGASGKFSARQYELWKRFLVEASNLRVVSRDTWIQFLEFMREIDPAFANHDFDAAWPSVIDEFVAWVRAGRHGTGDRSP
ncbi:Scaffold-type E3 ligase [Malassezia sp. CBS 17886]|nr:Scaffold-type E3 ligase [Malassezia sp. CBS 17886]